MTATERDSYVGGLERLRKRYALAMKDTVRAGYYTDLLDDVVREMMNAITEDINKQKE